jgi:hypothetical protein
MGCVGAAGVDVFDRVVETIYFSGNGHRQTPHSVAGSFANPTIANSIETQLRLNSQLNIDSIDFLYRLLWYSVKRMGLVTWAALGLIAAVGEAFCVRAGDLGISLCLR